MEGMPKQYKRDTLLQLRMHPLSLQRPNVPQQLDIVKDRLYMHHINEESDSAEGSNPYYSNSKPYSGNTKLQNEYVYHYSPSGYSQYYPPRNCLRFTPNGKCSSVCNAAAASQYSAASLGSQRIFSPAQKYFTGHSDRNASHRSSERLHCGCVDFSSSTRTWYKQRSTSADYATKNATKFTEPGQRMKSTRRKKILAIIDPNTGENIFESLAGSSSDSSDKNAEDKNDSPKLEEELKGEKIDVAGGGNGVKGENKNARDNSEDGTVNGDINDNTKMPAYCNGEVVSKLSPMSADTLSQVDSSVYEKNTTDSSSQENNSIRSSPSSEDFVSADANNGYPSRNFMHSFMSLRTNVHTMEQEQQNLAQLQQLLFMKKVHLDKNSRKLERERSELSRWESQLNALANELKSKTENLESKEQESGDKTNYLKANGVETNKQGADVETIQAKRSHNSEKFMSLNHFSAPVNQVEFRCNSANGVQEDNPFAMDDYFFPKYLQTIGENLTTDNLYEILKNASDPSQNSSEDTEIAQDSSSGSSLDSSGSNKAVQNVSCLDSVVADEFQNYLFGVESRAAAAEKIDASEFGAGTDVNDGKEARVDGYKEIASFENNHIHDISDSTYALNGSKGCKSPLKLKEDDILEESGSKDDLSFDDLFMDCEDTYSLADMDISEKLSAYSVTEKYSN